MSNDILFDNNPGDAPDFKLPPFKVEKVFTTLSQSMDWGLKQLKVPETWSQTQGEGVTVLVIDTGLPATREKDGSLRVHPDLAGAILVDKCKSFVPNEDIVDVNGHNTMCAGIIGARDNAIGYVGYAPKCKIVTYKALADSGEGRLGWIEQALKAAIELKPDVVSMSLGSTQGSWRIQDCIQKLDKMNIPVVCAAGNGGKAEGVNYPAKYPESFAIAAYDKYNQIADFSAVGPEVDFALPGVDIISTNINNSYAKLSGTSFSAPGFAGILALMIAKHRKQHTETGCNDCITTQQMYEHIRKHAINKSTPGERDIYWGWGMLDVVNMFNDDDKPQVEEKKVTITFPVWEWIKKIINWFKG